MIYKILSFSIEETIEPVQPIEIGNSGSDSSDDDDSSFFPFSCGGGDRGPSDNDSTALDLFLF